MLYELCDTTASRTSPVLGHANVCLQPCAHIKFVYRGTVSSTMRVKSEMKIMRGCLGRLGMLGAGPLSIDCEDLNCLYLRQKYGTQTSVR